jgi:two-component system, OmpR family, sensor histidine kinase KdpD
MSTKAIKEPWTARLPGPVPELLAVAGVIGLTPVLLFLFGREDVANVAIAYLFGIAFVSLRVGHRASVVAAVASAMAFDYFFLFPYHSLVISHVRQLVSFGAMLVTALFISSLNERLRRQARAARHSERRTEQNYALVKALAEADSLEALCTSAAQQLELVSNASSAILLRGPDDKFRCSHRAGGAAAVEAEDLQTAEWAASHLEAAGLGTRNLPQATATYLPLAAARGCVGVVTLRPRGGGSMRSSLTMSMTRQIAIAIERMLLADEKRTALLEAETERIRSAVLSSVSHDLRAPMAVIASASSTLLEHGNRLPANGREEMARIIHEEARRLNELLKSLLDITRLQSGSLHVNRDWESIEEVVGSVLRRIEARAGGRHLLTSVPSELPLLHVDAILVEQVLLNLLDNAIKHSGSEDPIEVEVAVRGVDSVVVSVIDHGTGIDSSELTRIFDKFYRGAPAAGGGLGLGLTIAQGIVNAHGGRIWANPTVGGGLTIQFTLPINAAAAPGPVVGMGTEPLEGLAS